MTPEQKQSFYEDGYLIFRDIVPQEIVKTATRHLYGGLSATWQASMGLRRSTRENDEPVTLDEGFKQATDNALSAGTAPAILDLVNPDHPLMHSIAEALGRPVHKPRGAQLATIFPHQPTARIVEAGYPAEDIPFYTWHGHLDGLWNGAAPVHQRTDRGMNEEESARWYRDPARNSVRRTYPGNINVMNFTALLGIPLSDQMLEGAGNLGLLRGAHHPMSEFFRYQRDAGGPLGPDGPGWERIDVDAPNRTGLRHYPDQVREQFSDDAEYSPDGRMWPKPELIKVKPGDAVLALHAVPHSATRLEGLTPRLMAYYRLVSSARPIKASQNLPEALCDCWYEWAGMREVVASQ